MSENCNLAYFVLQRRKCSSRIVTNRVTSTYASGKTAKRLRYSYRACHHVNTAVIAGDTPGKTFYEQKIAR